MLFYVIIGIILLVAAIVIVSSILRKRIYKQIDRYESWKIDIMNRPVTEEISKVKELKMVGETEKKFETWRADWDEIVTTELPLIEEKLFDAEEMADKFRFRKAQKVIDGIKKNFDSIETQLKEMLGDLNVVVESEEKNRTDIVSVKETFHAIKKDLITNRPQYKKTVPYLESQLGQIEGDLTHYENESEEGNVIKAREILMRTQKHLEALSDKMEKIPVYYKDIHSVIPGQLRELESGTKEMIDQEYVLEHLKIDEQVREIRKHLEIYETGMENTEFKEVAEGIDNTFNQLDYLYDQLEKEVTSRSQLKEDASTLEIDLKVARKKIKDINHETDIVQQSYRVDDEVLKTRTEIDETFEKMDKEYKEVHEVLKEKKQAFSIILEKVEDMRKHLDNLHDHADDFKEKLASLRKDEIEAKESLQQLKQQLLETRRKVQKSNLPGVPNAYVTLIEDGEEVLNEVSGRLDQSPLEIHAIKQLIVEANEKINLVYDKTDELVESAILTEQLIQYGNRYRSQNSTIDEELNKAEAYFRSYNYNEAVEIAASAIYKLDPSIVKKFKVEIESVG